MWLKSIIPLLKSARREFIESAFMNSATFPSTNDETLFMKEKISKIAVATTAEIIWFPERDEPSIPMAKAAAP